MEIVRTYSDVESGLNIRDGLQRLLEDVESGRTDYSVVLVYDVSRWGRFQDIDESAYYEYRCKRAGIAVHYCAEQFENDGGFLSSLMKNIKRSMAGEYSRELSVKVFVGQCRVARLGFIAGGPQGYGLRRAIVDGQGNLKQVLSPRGDRKAIQTDRIILVPGPKNEVKVVNEIYDHFIQDKWSYTHIATWLNSRGNFTHMGQPWSYGKIRDVLRSEKYVGTNVFNKRSQKLGRKSTPNPPEKWIRVENAFAPVVSPDKFREAQTVIANRTSVLSDSQLLERLRAFCLRTERVSKELITADVNMPSISVYWKHFGGLTHAYQLIGYRPRLAFKFVELNRQVKKQRDGYAEAIVRQLEHAGATTEVDAHSKFVRINGEFTLAIICARCRDRHHGPGRLAWELNPSVWSGADIALVIRLKPGNQEILDYYLFPACVSLPAKLQLTISNSRDIDVHRFSSLDLLMKMARRVPLEERYEPKRDRADPIV